MSSKTDTRPIWFLDVDGVLNALSLAPPFGFAEAKARIPGQGTFPIKWNPRLIEEINLSIEQELIEVVWLTTWGHWANTVLSPIIGLPGDLRVAAEPNDFLAETFGRGWWKFEAVQKWHADNPSKQFIWTDDDLRIEQDAWKWAKSNGFFTSSPDPYTGLLMNDVERIRTWAVRQDVH